jgi:uncharacterized membrane protein YfcA
LPATAARGYGLRAMEYVPAIGLGLLGLAVGVLGTLIGAGGGFVLLPILLFLYPRDSAAVLTAISLAVVCANASSGSIAYARLRRIDLRAGLVFAAAGLPGAVLGAWTTRYLERRLFDPMLGVVLMIGAAIVALRPVPEADPECARPRRTLVEADGTVHEYAPRTALGALLSVVVGFLSSLLGIGGGILHVPAMVYLLGFPPHVATATSHFVLALLSLSAVLVHARDGTMAHAMGRTIPLAAGALVGAQLGAGLSSRVHGRWILRALALALAAVGMRLLFAH